MGIQRRALHLLLVSGLSSLGCNREQPAIDTPSTVTVLRVESSSPEHPGAEHCERDSNSCSPLAASQKIPARGLVRTFAGGKLSLDFGGGRRVDLGSLSQLELGQQMAHLKQGDFSIDSTPLISKETAQDTQPLTFTAAGQSFSATSHQPTTTALSVGDQATWLTVRRGSLSAPGLNLSPRVGQSIRLLQARAFRTAADGGELPSLLPVAPRGYEFGDLLQPSQPSAQRGLGTMSARLPNTSQKREGVRLLKHHTKVYILDGYARTEVEEEFENTTPHILEGQYRFAVPSDASLARLGLWVGDQLMEGEVLERARARAIYTSIVDRPVPRDPALLEWENGGELSLKVFPILAHNTRRVTLAYHQALSAEGGLLRYVYPLSLGPDRTNHIEDLSIEIIAQDSTAELGRPQVLGYDAQVSSQGTRHTLLYREHNARPGRDFSVVFERKSKDTAEVSAHVTRWGDDEPYLAHVLSKGASPAPSGSPPVLVRAPSEPNSEGYFGLRLRVDLPPGMERPAFRPLQRALVIDTSHSQSKETISAQAALAFGLLLEMDPEEPFVLLGCDSACEVWSSLSSSEPSESSSSVKWPARLAGAHAFLKGLKPGGASDVAGAIAAAATHLNTTSAGTPKVRQIVYMGDGRASAGELSALGIAERVGPLLVGTELRLVGVGHALDRAVLRGLAIELGATLDDLHSGVALEARIFELAGFLRRPIITQPRLDLPPGLIAAESQALPALRLGQEIVLTGQITHLDPGNVVLTGQLNQLPYRLEKKVQLNQEQGLQNPLLPSLWATNRIALLQSLEPTTAIQAQIIDLSTRYRTMSRYTSFLVLESDAMYKEFGITRPEREQQPDAVSDYLDRTSGRFDDQTPADESRRRLALSPEPESKPAFDLAQAAKAAAPAAPSMTAAPSSGGAPRSAVAPKPKMSRPEGSSASEAFSSEARDKEIGAESGRASGSHAAPRKGEAADLAAEEMDFGKRRHHYSPPRFHLNAVVANDEWRRWGEDQLARLSDSLSSDPNSRARNEAWLRALLSGGRFEQAQRAAENFYALDPDHQPAVQLLGFSSVVNEDRERARLMLDIQSELFPDAQDVHQQAARAFSAAGDVVRACAHYRSLKSLLPEQPEAAQKGDACWAELLGGPKNHDQQLSSAAPGQLEVQIECDAPTAPRDCPSPVLVTPYGEVFSPWSPGPGRSDKQRISLLRVRSGSYFLLVAGGAPGASGRAKISGRHENASLAFSGGALHTVAKINLQYY